jgi:hypothetical protein
MNQYITFHKVLDLIEDFQQQSPILNSFGYGNLVDFSRTISGDTQNSPVKYPYLFVVPLTIQYDENTTEYQLSLIFADILTADMMNEKDAVSDMSLECRRFLSYVKRGINTFPELYDNMDLQLPVQAIPFMERMADHIAGVAIDVNLTVFEDINACDYYPTPTPTQTSTSTPTPTVTPTNTLTPTPTPTDARECRTYSISSFTFISYTFVNCDGTTISTSSFGGTFTLCAKQDSIVITLGSGSITDIGPC